MSTEVCPHCGKTFKRLKSHLPHCKAASSSKTPQTARDGTTSQTPSAHPAAALSKTSIQGQKTKQTCLQAEKDKMAASPKPLLVSPSSTTSAKKKQKVADQTKSTTLFPSPPPPTFSKPKKKSLRALIEAAKLDQMTKESQKKTEESSFSCSKRNKILESNVKENATNPHARDGFRVENQEETEESPAQKLLSKSGSGQVKVTLQDVKATLCRANGHGRSDRPSIPSLIVAADLQSSNIRLDADFSSVTTKNLKDAVSLSASDLLLRSNGQLSELQLFHRKSKPSALIPQQQGAACQLEPDSPAAFILSASQVQQATPPPGKLSLNVDQRTTRLPSGSSAVSPFSSFLLSPAAAQTLPARVEESQLEVGKPNAAENPAEGALTQKSLGQVRLKELPTWLASRTPSRPRDVADLVQSGWRWYYRRYTDVKKGGVAGLSMLLVGYCVLSYIWSYPHIKLSRWRKYH
ncbi:uncharacterized protein C17orf80 [Nematolebias whitei]|uniref:uncharacterized protein C17orf80 n=1 Tax=Nematolebias whitei TaxID=451745 RepID=UPI00189BEDC4|nr:uncharacterized protein C17orf80 [Nematolebias whitei]